MIHHHDCLEFLSIFIVTKNTYGKNLKALTSKLFEENASLISSSVTVALENVAKLK